MIKAIIFDIGGVYLKGDFESFVSKVNKELKINRSYDESQEVEFNKILIKSTSLKQCFIDFFNTPISSYQFKIVKEMWEKNWIPDEGPDEEMVSLTEQLKKNYKLAVLSNSEKSLAEIYEKNGWYSFAEEVILSHEVGFIKPQKEIFKIALERINLQPEKCLFIDDQEINIQMARELGIKGIQYKNIEQLKKELISYGITID